MREIYCRYHALLLVCLLCILPGTAYSASFDCNKASTTLEITICTDANLDNADSQLGKVYLQLRQALSKADFDRLKQEQRQWLKTRTSYCQPNDAACMLPVYQARIAVLQSRLGGSSPTPPPVPDNRVITEEMIHPACFRSDYEQSAQVNSPPLNLSQCTQANAHITVETESNQRSADLEEGYIVVTDRGRLADGRKVFEILENTGGTGRFSSLLMGYIEQRGGQLWLSGIENHHFGDRANGGLQNAFLDSNNRLWVETSITPADLPALVYSSAEELGLVSRQELSGAGGNDNLADSGERAAAFFQGLNLPYCSICYAGNVKLVYDDNSQTFMFAELYWEWQPDANSSEIEYCVADLIAGYGREAGKGYQLSRNELAELARPLRLCAG